MKNYTTKQQFNQPHANLKNPCDIFTSSSSDDLSDRATL